MQQIQFLGTTPNDFINELKTQLIPEIKKQLAEEFQPKQATEYLTRDEVCQLLKIDLSTLHRWRKNKTIISYGLGNRVYFKRKEVDQLINNNQLI